MRDQKTFLTAEIMKLERCRVNKLNTGLLDELYETVNIGLEDTPYLHDVVLRRLLIRIYFETLKLDSDTV